MSDETGKLWSETAPFWEKHRDAIQAMFAPVSEALIAEAAIRPGQIVLDVATGPGEPALTIAGLIGAHGLVVGTDLVPAMIEAAQREADRRELRNVSFQTAGAERAPFDDETFDAVTCRFGVMFFPSPLDGVREILRVLKPGGVFSLAVWHFPERNPFHCVLSQIVGRYVESPPADADAPDAFRFAPPGKLLQVVRQAGAAGATERLLQFTIHTPVSGEDFWNLRREMSDKLRAKLTLLSEDQIAAIKRELLEALEPYRGASGFDFPSEVLIVSGRRAVPARGSR